MRPIAQASRNEILSVMPTIAPPKLPPRTYLATPRYSEEGEDGGLSAAVQRRLEAEVANAPTRQHPRRTNDRLIDDDDDGAAPASHYSTIASHRDLRRCHDGGTARPRSPRARPTSSLRERPGRVRSCSSSPLDLTSGGPARGLHAPPGPNGLLRGRHVPPALLPPHRPLTPRVVSLFSPQRS